MARAAHVRAAEAGRVATPASCGTKLLVCAPIADTRCEDARRVDVFPGDVASPHLSFHLPMQVELLPAETAGAAARPHGNASRQLTRFPSSGALANTSHLLELVDTPVETWRLTISSTRARTAEPHGDSVSPSHLAGPSPPSSSSDTMEPDNVTMMHAQATPACALIPDSSLIPPRSSPGDHLRLTLHANEPHAVESESPARLSPEPPNSGGATGHGLNVSVPQAAAAPNTPPAALYIPRAAPAPGQLAPAATERPLLSTLPAAGAFRGIYREACGGAAGAAGAAGTAGAAGVAAGGQGGYPAGATAPAWAWRWDGNAQATHATLTHQLTD